MFASLAILDNKIWNRHEPEPRNALAKKPRVARLFWLPQFLRLRCGFVPNGTTDFFREICWKFVHTVLFAAMFGALLQNVLFSLASRHEVPVHAYISTSDYLGHVAS
jgi:hypothetical protein